MFVVYAYARPYYYYYYYYDHVRRMFSGIFAARETGRSESEPTVAFRASSYGRFVSYEYTPAVRGGQMNTHDRNSPRPASILFRKTKCVRTKWFPYARHYPREKRSARYVNVFFFFIESGRTMFTYVYGQRRTLSSSAVRINYYHHVRRTYSARFSLHVK